MKQLIFYVTLFLLIMAISTAAQHFDFDLWARLIAGMGVIDGGQVLTEDFLSYTPVHTWWDHEWGAGVIFYACLKYFGPYSLIILQAILIFLIFFTSSKVVNMRNENPYNILFYFFGIMALMPTLNNPIRCHLFSFLFFTLCIYILEKEKKYNSKLIYVIPLIILIWGNIHGGVASGIGVLLIYTIGEALNKKPFKKYLIILIISCLSLFVNPWGIDYVKFLLMANTMPRPNIVEWWSIFSKYHLLNYLEFKIFMIFILTSQIIYISKKIKENKLKKWILNIDKTKYILIILTLFLSVIHVKMMPFFVIISICFMYEDFYELFNIKMPEWKDKAVYVILLLISCLTFVTKEFSLPVGIDIYPVKEIEFIKINHLEGKLLTNFGIGSYAAYKLYPQNTIFMDGRYEEVYYDYMLPIQKEFFIARKPEYIMDNFKPDIIVIEKSYKDANIYLQKKWQNVYSGKSFVVYLPKEKSKKTFLQPTDNMDYYKTNLFATDIKFHRE